MTLSVILRQLWVVITAFAVTGAIIHFTFEGGTWINDKLISAEYNTLQEWVFTVFYVIFCIYIIGIIFPFFLFLGWRRLGMSHQKFGDNTPLVSVIIPAFNEEKAVEHAIRGAFNQNYPNFEVIVVDDGSRDFTPYLIENKRITFISLNKNRGKAAALNAGISRSKGEIIVFSDADSILDRQAIRHLVRHFDDPLMGAVAGRVEITDSNSLIVCWQILEYLMGQEIVKHAQIGSGTSVLIAPGPVSAIRRELLMMLGGYKDRTLVEDFDITLDIIDQGYRVGYDPHAVALTLAPTNWSDLRRQRIRWYRGNLQVLSVYRRLLMNFRKGLLGLFWLPYSLLNCYWSVLFEIILICFLPYLLWMSGTPLASFTKGLIFMLVIELLASSQYLIALFLANRLKLRLIYSAFLMKPYCIFQTWIRIKSIWQEIKQREMKWNG